MSELSSIKSQALTERIEERLFAYILDNHLKVGAKLPNEHELAAHFEVSRGTVREAVKLLVSRGVLRVKHGSGTYVASLFRSTPIRWVWTRWRTNYSSRSI